MDPLTIIIIVAGLILSGVVTFIDDAFEKNAESNLPGWLDLNLQLALSISLPKTTINLLS